MTRLRKLAFVELKLFLRDPTAAFLRSPFHRCCW